MGVPLPCFGYFVASGKPKCYHHRNLSLNKKNEKIIKDFCNKLRETSVNKIPNTEDKWKQTPFSTNIDLVEVYFETNTADFPELRKIVDRIERQGTIIVPKLINVFQKGGLTVDIINKVIDKNIAILPIKYKFKLYGKQQNYDLGKLEKDELANRVEKVVIDNRAYANKFFNGREGKKKL